MVMMNKENMSGVAKQMCLTVSLVQNILSQLRGCYDDWQGALSVLLIYGLWHFTAVMLSQLSPTNGNAFVHKPDWEQSFP